MKKFFLLISLIFSCVAHSQTVEKTQLQLHSFTENRSENGMANLFTLFEKNWPIDVNGDKECACVRVRFVNMATADAENVSFNFGNSAPIKEKRNRLKEDNEVWLFVTPTDFAFMEARLDKYGTSNRLPNIKLEPKHVYDVVLKNDITVSINVITQPEGAVVSLETGQRSTTPATLSDITLGKHILTISNNGRRVKTDTIEVTETNIKFEYDLRPKKSVRIKTDPAGATIVINGEKLTQLSPVEIELPHDNYHIEAILTSKERDSKTIRVNDYTDEIILNPIERKAFDVIAIYEGSSVPADLYVNGQLYKDKNGNAVRGAKRYSFNEPVGSKYKMKMSYYGDTKERTIKVKRDMNVDQIINIKPRNRITWPWQREYDSDVCGVALGYVQKQLVTKGYGEQLKENGMWDDGEGKWLRGMQAGVHFQPAFSWGLGLYTGLFWEMYISFNDNYDYNMYTEHDLYLPIHAYYRIPFSRSVALKIHGGLGLSYAIAGTFSQTDDYYGYEDYNDALGSDYFPGRLNCTLDIGISFRIKNVQINASYCKGFNNHKSYESIGEDYKTTQNKISISASWIISAGD